MQTQTTDTLQTTLKAPYDNGAMFLREGQIREGIKALGLQRVAEKELHAIFNATPHSTLNESEAQLSGILGMVHTLIIEDRIGDLHKAFMKAFPEYYYSDEDAKKAA